MKIVEPSPLAREAIDRMGASFDYDAKEVFFAMWANMVGVPWSDMTNEDRKVVMQRLNYAWCRAVGV